MKKKILFLMQVIVCVPSCMVASSSNNIVRVDFNSFDNDRRNELNHLRMAGRLERTFRTPIVVNTDGLSSFYAEMLYPGGLAEELRDMNISIGMVRSDNGSSTPSSGQSSLNSEHREGSFTQNSVHTQSALEGVDTFSRRTSASISPDAPVYEGPNVAAVLSRDSKVDPVISVVRSVTPTPVRENFSVSASALSARITSEDSAVNDRAASSASLANFIEHSHSPVSSITGIRLYAGLIDLVVQGNQASPVRLTINAESKDKTSESRLDVDLRG